MNEVSRARARQLVTRNGDLNSFVRLALFYYYRCECCARARALPPINSQRVYTMKKGLRVSDWRHDCIIN